VIDPADNPELVLRTPGTRPASWNRFFTENPPPRTTVAVHQLPDPDLRID
jgi:enamine deaminase RidA (YjgF/YER057c/UK114 family)